MFAVIYSTNTIFYLSIAFILYYAVVCVKSWHRLRHFPGPTLGSLSYLFIARTSNTGKPWATYTRLNRENGPLVRIGPNNLITDDPDIIRRMGAVRSPYIRGAWYGAMKLNPHDETLFTLRDTIAHDKLKAKLAAGYSGRENLQLESGSDLLLAKFIDVIRGKYLSSDEKVVPFDLARSIQFFTLDTITKLAYGEEFGYMETDSDIYDYIKTTEEAVPFLQLCGEWPLLQKIIFSPLMLGFLGPKITDKNGLGRLMA
jgi:hypothetical protein